MLSFLWWIIYEIWASFTNYLWSYFWKANPWQYGSTGTRHGVYHRKKMGQKYRRTLICITHFGPLLPNCKSGMLFLGGKFWACLLMRPKVGWVEEATQGGQSYQQEIEGISVDKITLCCRFNMLPEVVMLKYDKVPGS